ncbi:MAG: ferrous iron transport protein A [Bacteroidia bacterium]|jgi:ferrous iron transport protein A|nr:ferrous iron transport protein A [Bacteroidia bacterium]
MKLSKLPFGKEAIVESIADTELSLKLLEMGLLPGETVALENIAPFGDPIAVRVGEYKMCLRLQDADCVMVNVIS